ncbi:MAG: hypothetical protein AAGD05_01335 [Bacteroidota bacterium]
MKIKVLLFGLFLLGFAFSTQAQTATPKVVDRQVTQQKRIQQGVRSGELSKKETVRLQKQQRHINRSKKRAKADGVVTKKERAQLHRKQNRASKNVYRAKHN